MSSLNLKLVLQFCFKILLLPPYWEVGSDPDPSFLEKLDPDPKKTISDPQPWLCQLHWSYWLFTLQDEQAGGGGLTCSRRRCEDSRSLSVLQDVLRQSADPDLSRPSAAIIKLDTAESQVHSSYPLFSMLLLGFQGIFLMVFLGFHGNFHGCPWLSWYFFNGFPWFSWYFCNGSPWFSWHFLWWLSSSFPQVFIVFSTGCPWLS